MNSFEGLKRLPEPTVRAFRASQHYDQLATFAIGRNHASWFLIHSKAYGMSLKRAELCLNYITSDPSTVGAVCPETGRPMFTVGGTMGEEVLETLLDLRDDKEKKAPITVVKRYEKGRKDGKLAEVRVEVPDSEIAYACARCGRWENEHQGVKFQRCSACKSRYYCIPLVSVRSYTYGMYLTRARTVSEGGLDGAVPQDRLRAPSTRQGTRGRDAAQVARQRLVPS